MPSSHDVPTEWRFERSSTFESLEEIVEAAQQFAARVFGDAEAAHRFVLAVSEAVSNAIEHGNAADPDKQVTAAFHARTEAALVEATVTDEGRGFDPAAVDDPLDEEHLTRTHGRGLHIIQQAADEVSYEADGCRVRMRFFRDA
jgi:serine/threonine-protein kinase RsbW